MKNDEVHRAPAFMEQAQRVLRKMIQKGVRSAPHGRPFDHFHVVIGKPPEKCMPVIIVEVPNDLRVRINNEKVYVVNCP